jgi:hypothetical protein
MSQRRWRRIGIGCMAAALAALPIARVGAATTTSASTSELKAAFVLNFVRFTEWPAEATPGNAPMIVCLMDPDVARAFEQIVKGRTANNREIQSRWTRKDPELRGCQVAYVTGLDDKRSSEVIAMLQDSPVLTISDDEQFAARGGMANLFIEHDNIGIAVNVAAVQRAKLQVSSKLLSLARIVRR